MGDVAIIYKIMPDGTEVDLADLKSRIEKSIQEPIRLNQINEKPVAFGLKALEVQIIMDDKSGGAETLEKALNDLEGVQSVEVVHIGLL
ncbi:MAG: elongation factor 1-beta [Thermoplasmata archaeon]|nr:MAG: elongation factor 1-beta [Thermoplasmata archaeon]